MPVTDYSAHWQVSGGVFLRPVSVDDLYVPDALKGLLERLLLFCRSEQALVVVSGEPGTGKSTLLRWLHQNLSQDTHDVLLTAMVQRETRGGWLTPRLAELLGVPTASLPTQDLGQSIREVASRLDELVAEKRKLIVAVDAAHLASTPEALSEVAALLNLQALAGTCLSFVLVGDPALGVVLEHATDLSAKLAFNLTLPKLSLDETTAYVGHRLRQAGMASPFEPEVLALIHQRSRGIMAGMNAFAENCLVEAFQRGVRGVTLEIARAAAKHLTFESAAPLNQASPFPPVEGQAYAPPPPPKKQDRPRDGERPESPSEPVAIKLTSLFKSDR